MKSLVPTILILIAIGVFYTFVNPHWQATKVLLSEKDQYDQALTKSKELQRIRGDLLAQYNAMNRGDLDKLKKILPDNVDNVQLLIDLQSIASRYNISIKNVKNVNTGVVSVDGKKPEVAEAKNVKYKSADLGFTASATYSDFKSFLSELEKSLRLIDVTKITFVSNDSGRYDFDIGIRAYWLK